MKDKLLEESNGTSDEQKVREKVELALSILKAAITNLGIKDISEYNDEPRNLRWRVYSQNIQDDLTLRILIQGLFGMIDANVSLLRATVWIIEEIEIILNKPDATKLLDFTEEERPEILYENALGIIKRLIQQLPIISFQILNQALKDSIQAHLNNDVKPRLKDHWKELGLPEDFTLNPSDEFTNELKSIDDQFKNLRKGFLGDKRAWLTTEKRLNLPNEHEELRAAYQAAKDYYNQSRKAFFLGKRNRTIDEWDAEWMTNSLRTFPDLSYRCLKEINDHQPFELAHIHLADSYGYSPQYMMKLVSKFSGLKPKKAKRKPKKSE